MSPLWAEEILNPPYISVGANFSGNTFYENFSSEITQNYFLFMDYSGIFREGDHLRLLAESRYIYEKEGVPKMKNGSNRAKNRYTFSGEFVSDLFYISSGKRFLPVFGSSFNRETDLYSGFSNVAQPKNKTAHYFRVLGSNFLPGVFGIEGYGGPGIFFHDPSGKFFAAYHKESGLGAIFWDIYFPKFDGSFYSDINFSRETCSGYSSVRAKNSTYNLKVSLEAERREEWDYKEFENKVLYPDREGKSGMADMRTVYRENFTVEAAGMDRGVTGFRLIGAEYVHPLTFTSIRPALRIRGYRMMRYGWGESEEKENPEIRRKVWDRSWTAGIRWLGEGASFHLFYEQKREGPPLGEAGLSIKTGGVHFDFSAVYQKTADENTFVFIHAKNIGQSKAIFYNGVTGALLFGFRSRYLYFYFSAKKQNSGRTQRYGNMQFQIIF